MDISHLLARLFGIVLVVTYGGLLINRKFYTSIWQNLLQQPLLLFISGFMALVLGLIVIQVHSIWALDWRGLITFLGWLMVFQGIMRLVFPETVLKIIKKIIDNQNFLFIHIVSVIMFLIGLYLTYVGFVA